MMRSILALFILAHLAVASEVDTTFQSGVDAYKQRNYAKARESFEDVLVAGLESADLYYNLGNTAYRQKQFGYAVYYYRKALRLAPSHEDAQFNLELTGRHLADRINSPPDFFLFAMTKTWFYGLTRGTLFILVLSIWSSFWIALALHLERHVPTWIRWSAGFLAVGMVILLLMRVAIETSREDGIVVAGSTDVKSEPLEKASTLFILHGGTEVEIQIRENDWLEIRLADGKTGWLRCKALGIL